ncbi:MAG: hypothetical protein K0S37_3010 [Microbacterium sp.]|jgi:hypothetical protein|nr:hypothetical protein [Microbacterium sp.]
MQWRHHLNEAKADNVEKRWTDRDVLALLRSVNAPDYVFDRVADQLTLDQVDPLPPSTTLAHWHGQPRHDSRQDDTPTQ